VDGKADLKSERQTESSDEMHDGDRPLARAIRMPAVVKVRGCRTYVS